MSMSTCRGKPPRLLGRLALGTILLLGACDLPQPTSPFAAEPGPLLAELTEPLPLGSSGIQIPATNGWDQSAASYWQETPFTVEGWVHVEVSGGVTYARNADCYYASTPCSAPLDGATTGPLYSGGSSRIYVGHQPPGNPPATGTQSLPQYRFFPVDGGDPQMAMSAYSLRQHTTPQKLWVRREITYGGSWDPILATNTGFQYHLGGSQVLTVTLVPKPLEVRSPEYVAPGTKGIFRADMGQYQLRVPEGAGSGHVTLIYWLYYPNDTLPSQPSGYHQWVYGCEDKVECEYAPTAPGRMEAHAYVEGQLVSDRGEITRLQQTKLQLTCPPLVVRAQQVTCTASNPGGGTMTVQEWNFQPDPVVINPVAGPAQMAASVSETSAATSWSGPLVLPGTVTVRAVVGSETLSATAKIAVTERSWDTGNTWHGRIDLGWGRDHRPLTDSAGGRVTAGQNVHFPTLEPTSKYEGAENGPDLSHLLPITEGPNRGYQYFRQHTIRLNRGYRINKYITQANDHADIRIAGNWYTRWDALIQKGWGQPATLFDGTVQHESFGTNGRVGHQDGFVQAITGEVCGNLARRLERVAGSPERVNEEWMRVWGQAGDFINIAASHHRVHGHLPANTRIVMRSRSNPAPVQGTMQDPQVPQPTIPSYTECDMAATLGV